MSYKILHKTFVTLVISVIALAASTLWILHKYPPQRDLPTIIIIKSEEGPRGVQGVPGKRGEKGADGKNFWGHK